jgi:hypothetical protein
LTKARGWQTYTLEELWAALDDESYSLTPAARDGMADLGFTEQDGVECLRALAKTVFCKSEPDKQGRRVFHDIYKTQWDGRHVYVKFFRADPGGPFIITSFKRDTDKDY